MNANQGEALARGLHAEPSLPRMQLRLIVCLSIVLATNLAFWLLADSAKWEPPRVASGVERVALAALTASGPLAMAIDGHFASLGLSVVITCGICAGLVTASLVWRRLRAARVLGYLGIILWFLFGSMVAGLSIS